MQIVVADRQQFYDVVTIESSPPIDVTGVAMVIIGLTVHAISGTSPQIAVQLRTSDDLDTWEDVGSDLSRTTAGWSGRAVVASSTPYGRYVRVEYAITGTSPLVNATVTVNTFAST